MSRGGVAGHPLYNTWAQMKGRCRNPRNHNFKNYGARGIRVCADWLSDFATFAANMGPRPEGTTLDRIDNDGNYEPSNCRWATMREQCVAGRRRQTHFVLNGEKHRNARHSNQTIAHVRILVGLGFPQKVIAKAFKMSFSYPGRIARAERRAA